MPKKSNNSATGIKRNGRRRLDWPALKLEFMSGNMSLNELRNKYKIGNLGSFYKQSKGWNEERNNLANLALKKLEKRTVGVIAKQWDNQDKLWKAVEVQAGRLLQKSLNNEKNLAPRDLDNLASAIEKALKSRRLIAGQSTENIVTKGIHMQLMDIGRKIDSGEPIDDIPAEVRAKIVEGAKPLQDKE